MADLSLPQCYRDIWGGSYTHTHKNRKVNGKIMPNYDSWWNYHQIPIDHYDIPYSEYKTIMLGKVKLCELTKFRGMIVNRGGHDKTNTTESRYKHLRRMIKDGLLIMKKHNRISILVTA